MHTVAATMPITGEVLAVLMASPSPVTTRPTPDAPRTLLRLNRFLVLVGRIVYVA